MGHCASLIDLLPSLKAEYLKGITLTRVLAIYC